MEKVIRRNEGITQQVELTWDGAVSSKLRPIGVMIDRAGAAEEASSRQLAVGPVVAGLHSGRDGGQGAQLHWTSLRRLQNITQFSAILKTLPWRQPLRRGKRVRASSPARATSQALGNG